MATCEFWRTGLSRKPSKACKLPVWSEAQQSWWTKFLFRCQMKRFRGNVQSLIEKVYWRPGKSKRKQTGRRRRDISLWIAMQKTSTRVVSLGWSSQSLILHTQFWELFLQAVTFQMDLLSCVRDALLVLPSSTSEYHQSDFPAAFPYRIRRNAGSDHEPASAPWNLPWHRPLSTPGDKFLRKLVYA